MSRVARPAEVRDAARRSRRHRRQGAREKARGSIRLGRGIRARHRTASRRRAHRGAAAFVRLRREKIPAAQCLAVVDRVPAWCCCWRARSASPRGSGNDAERQSVMAVERLADSRAAEEFTSTVLIENIQPGQTLTFEQLIARSEQIAQDTGSNDLRTRIFATDFLSAWYSANGLYRNAEMILTRTIDSLPADEPLRRRDAALSPREVVGRARSTRGRGGGSRRSDRARRCRRRHRLALPARSIFGGGVERRRAGCARVRAGGATTLRPDRRRIGVRPRGHPDGDRRRLRHHGRVRRRA